MPPVLTFCGHILSGKCTGFLKGEEFFSGWKFPMLQANNKFLIKPEKLISSWSGRFRSSWFNHIFRIERDLPLFSLLYFLIHPSSPFSPKNLHFPDFSVSFPGMLSSEKFRYGSFKIILSPFRPKRYLWFFPLCSYGLEHRLPVYLPRKSEYRHDRQDVFPIPFVFNMKDGMFCCLII